MRATVVVMLLMVLGMLVPVPDAAAARTINVSPGGSDSSGQGSESAPYATLAKALEAAANGDTIVLGDGVYREGELVAHKSVKIVEAPGATAVLDGSEVIDGWKANGDGSWTTQRSDLVRFCQVCTTNANPEAEGMARFPEQVFVDGKPLKQVANRSELTQGTFWVQDSDPITLRQPGNNSAGYNSKSSRGAAYVLGSDPAGHRVEIVQRNRAVTITGEGLVWDGVDVRNYNAVQQWNYKDAEGHTLTGGGAFVVAAANVQVNNSTFSHVSSGSAVALDNADKATIRGNSFVDNGGVGLNANRSDDIVVENNKWSMNNRSGFIVSDCGAYCTMGDTKITHSLRPRYANNEHDYSASAAALADPDVASGDRLIGVWLDEGVIGATIVNNHFVNIGREAIFSEVSSSTIIASNIIEDSFQGILVSGSDHDKIYNNTIVDTLVPIGVREDTRYGGCNARNGDGSCAVPENWSIERGVKWDVSATEIHNNALLKAGRFSGKESGKYTSLVTIKGDVNGDGKQIFANQMISGMDHDVYYRPDAKAVPHQVRWNHAKGAILETNSLADLTSDKGVSVAGVERNGQDIVAPRGQQQLFTSLRSQEGGSGANDLRPKAGGPLDDKGAALPKDVADAIGVSAGGAVDVGALNNVAWSGKTQQNAPAPKQADPQPKNAAPAPKQETSEPKATTSNAAAPKKLPSPAPKKATDKPKATTSSSAAGPKQAAPSTEPKNAAPSSGAPKSEIAPQTSASSQAPESPAPKAKSDSRDSSDETDEAGFWEWLFSILRSLFS